MNNKAMHRMRRIQQGVTLVELIFTLAITAIVLSIAVPSLSSLIAGIQMTTAVNNFVGNLHFARNEAIKRFQKVVLCPTSDGTSCLDSFEWHQGLMIFVKSSGEGTKRESDDPILRTLIPFSERVSIKTSKSRQALYYLPTGTSPASTTTIKFCHPSGRTDRRGIVISNTRTRISREDEEIKCN